MNAGLRCGAIAFATLVLASCGGRGLLQGSPATPATIQPPEPTPISRTPEATPQQRAQLRAELAAGYYERGQMGVALEELAEAIRLDPDNARAYNVYGLVYTVLGQDAKAEENFQRALTLAPQDSEIRHNWGWYLCTHGKPREALPEFESALRNPLYRTPEIALVNAGRCAVLAGDSKAAEMYYRRALVAAPNDPNASFGLAASAYEAGRYAEARSWMKGALSRPNPSAETLYLGMCIERHLGDRDTELSYVSQLRNRYPDSPETKALAGGGCK